MTWLRRSLIVAGVVLAAGVCLYLLRLPAGVPEQPSGAQTPSRHHGLIDGSDYLLDDPDIPPLLHALALGDAEKAHALIAEGAKVNIADRYGITPLMVAIADAKAAVPELLAAGAEVNARDKIEGQTALFIAARLGDVPLARELVRGGADVNATTIYGVTPLAEAAGRCRVALVQFLVHEGAHVNAKYESGGTALMSAAGSGCREVVKTLTVAGADVKAMDKTGQTALSLAQAKGHTEIVELLRRAGARQ